MASLATMFKRLVAKPKSRGSSERSFASSGDSDSLKLPVELWMEVFRNISHPRTLAHIMQANRQLRAIVEEQLYHSVDLTGQTQFLKFRLSLISCPRRASFVRNLRLLDFADKDPIVSKILPHFLHSLRNLQKLAIEWEKQSSPGGTACCDALSCLPLSPLRSLRISTRPDPDRFLNFLAAHAGHLEELETTFTYLFEEPPIVDRLASTQFPALRVLECTSLFVGGHERVPAPPNLTHLYRPAFRGGELGRIAERLGSQLVSLRLGTRVQARETLPWSLRDVRTKFPRLRYLHVDMGFSLVPRIPTDVVDWFSDAASEGSGRIIRPNVGVAPRAGSKITLAWVFVPHTLPNEAQWDQFADQEATRVLTASGDFVECVLHKHHSRWISVRLSDSAEGQGDREVIREEMGDMERHWRRI